MRDTLQGVSLVKTKHAKWEGCYAGPRDEPLTCTGSAWFERFSEPILDFSDMGLHLQSFVFTKARCVKAALETLSLSSHHSFKSVPAGPRWGLTRPLWAPWTEWIAVYSEIQISSETYFTRKLSYHFNHKMNFKKYPWQHAIWNVKACHVLNFKYQEWPKKFTVVPIKVIILVILKMIDWYLSVRD